MRLSEAIAFHKAEIVADWLTEARTLAAEQRLSESAILNGIPHLLERLIEWTERERPVDARAYDEEAEHHAVHRLRLGYALPQIVGEYQALRTIITRRISPELDGDPVAQVERVNRAIDVAIADAVGRFTAERRRSDQEQSAESRERIIGVLAHDLRSPLSTISMAAERLQRSPALDPSLRASVERMMRGARSMEAMIRDLADFSRGRFAGGIPITPARVALGAVVRGVADDLQAAHPGRTIHRELSGDLTGTWDGERLRQALTNLVTNALVHGTGDVTVEAIGRDDALTLRVHNPGDPISPEAQARLFEPFHKSQRSTGLGLGLYIVREIVHAHGGTVDVTSDQAGTTFTVTIPRR
jgi:signal transduction histidine kinase